MTIMELKIQVFGNVGDIIGSNELIVKDVSSKDDLVKTLNYQYPKLSGTKYVVAVNRKISSQNDSLDEHSEVALIPPYSGG